MKRRGTFPHDSEFNTSHLQDPSVPSQMSKPSLSAPWDGPVLLISD